MSSPPPLPKGFLSSIKDTFPADAYYTDPADCWVYGYDNSRIHCLPQLVAFASSHDQILSLVAACNEYQIPLTARGRGTGTTGATTPVLGGAVVSLERMNRIVEFSPENRYITVEPGITNQEVQNAVADQGFFWPPDPTSAAYCSVGGNLAYNSAGPKAVKYGTPRENTLGLRCITGAGKELRLGVFTTKGVVGYDLTRLIIGSEGSLAIITEATLKLTPLAESKKTMRAIYADVGSAAKAVSQIMAQPIIPCALEFMDSNAIEMIRQYSKADLPASAGALLMIEVDGPLIAIDVAADKLSAAAKTEGLLNISVAKDEQEVKALWQTRKALSPALRKIAPKKINEDVVVPVTEIPTLIDGLDQISKQFEIPIVNFGHAGNGNIHVNLLYDPDNPKQNQNAEPCLDAVFNLVLKLKGTLSGEHGIGLVKKGYLNRELDHNTLDLMAKLKNQFDPNGILNPGK
ncbi:MAG: FAD-linked oxidase C-terminal domain-containing protein [Methylococcaceae bacterium]